MRKDKRKIVLLDEPKRADLEVMQALASVATAVECEIAKQTKIKSITIDPIEAETNSYPRTFDNLSHADGFMFTQGFKAPEYGYHKHKVRIEWSDGKEYNFRLDVNKNKDNSVTAYFKNLFHYYLDKELPEQITNDKLFQETREVIREIYLDYQTYL